MNDFDSLKSQMKELQGLARLQRSLRLGLRAAWLGIAGVLLGWSLNALWGWLPDSRTWLLLGLVFAMFPLVGLLISLTPSSVWARRMDRRLGLEEQVSTAWEVTARRTGEGSPGARQAPTAELSSALVADVLTILPSVRARMLKHGWFLERDLVALLLVLLLGGMVLVSSLGLPYSQLIGDAPQVAVPTVVQFQPLNQEMPTPPAGQQPPEQGGSAGQDGNSAGGEQPSDEPSAPGEQPGGDQPGSGPPDPGALSDALEELGQDLSQQAPTYDLGQSLQQGDLEGAAGNLDSLTDQLDDLSQQTRDQLAEDLREAAGEVDAAGEPGLAEDMRDAADALQGAGSQAQDQPEPSAGEALGQMAQDLRELAQEMQSSPQAGGGAGSGSSGGRSGSPEPAGRLQGESGLMELPVEDPSQSGLLSPAPPDAAGEGTASGSLDSSSSAGEDVVQSPLVPNTYLWKWRDVVSSYFER